MRKVSIGRDDAIMLLRKYNKDVFHIRHGLTVEQVMRVFASENGFEDEVDYWALVGLLHDLDYEMYPDEHCIQVVDILKEKNIEQDFINAICSHGYGHRVDIQPTHYMEKVLYATDELTGLIGACSLMRPSKSCKDMELKSLNKKFKDRKFASGCNRDIIIKGADMMGISIDVLLEKTLDAMKKSEDIINSEMIRLEIK
jgi:HD phosphohydrolase family protein